MIEIIDLQKQYQTKSKQTLKVLKGINLELGSKGFVVVLGKSGSGKSTLLNLLGGLDRFDSGDIIIKGKSTKEFSVKDWDSYRNTYVGFIFQNFFLIEKFTVGKNIAMALELQGYDKKEIPKLVNEVLTSVDLAEFKDRKPNELSGGQKQRIAIARALVKNPDIILADEPTGNLDSKTGKIILDTLKELSKEKLVIMVTHDINFANEYGDRIIELKNGEIVSDTVKNDQHLISETQDSKFNLKQSSLAFGSSFKLALSSIFTKKIKLFFMMILFILSLFFFGLATNFARYDVAKASSITFKENGINEILLYKAPTNCKYIPEADLKAFDEECESIRPFNINDDMNDFSEKFSNNKFHHIQQYPNLSGFDPEDYFYKNAISKYNIINYDDIDQFDSELIYGRKIENDNDVYITDYLAEYLSGIRWIKIDDYNELIDTPLIFSNYVFNIVGILETDYEKYEDIKDDYIALQNSSTYLIDVETKYNRIITTTSNINKFNETKIIETWTINNTIITENDRYNDFYSFGKGSSFDNNKFIGDSRAPRNDNEVVLPISMIGELFSTKDNSFEEYSENPEVVVNMFLGEVVNIKFEVTNSYDNKSHYDRDFEIVGFYDSDNNNYFDNNRIVINDSLFDEISMKNSKNEILVELGDNVKDTTLLLRDLNNSQYKHYSYYSELIYELDLNSNLIKDIFYIISFVLAIFTSIMMYTFIASTIKSKQKEIGTLRAIGAKGIDVSKIFLIEGLIITSFSVFITFILMVIGIDIFNREVSRAFNTDFVLLYNDYISMLAVIGLGLFVSLVASFIPVKRITIMKPIDAIKNK